MRPSRTVFLSHLRERGRIRIKSLLIDLRGARFIALFAFLLAAFGALSPSVALAEAPIVTEYKVEPPEHLTVGDRINVSIVVEADEGTEVQVAPGGIPEDLTLAQSVKYSTKNKGSGRIEVSIDLVLAPFAIGDYPMPPIKLRYRDSTGATGELETPVSRLLIESTVPGNAPLEPRDLKPQAQIGAPPPPPYGLLALAGAGFLLAVGLMYIAWRRLNRPILVPEAASVIEVLGPEDSARRSLDAAGAAFADKRDYGPYYAVLSRTVRGYLTERFGFPAFALTTTELQAQMVSRGMDRWQARLVAGLLEQCDAVVYTRYQPALERADADLTAAYEIVEMSRPLEELPDGLDAEPQGVGVR